MHKKKVELLILPVASPMLIGVYEEKKMLEQIEQPGKSSDTLPSLIKELMDRFTISGIYFINGPGSFMSIKVVYVLLKSLSILKGIPLFAADAFAFNGNEPLKAIGKSAFVKKEGVITIVPMHDLPPPNFELPMLLDPSKFSENIKPLYIAPAV